MTVLLVLCEEYSTGFVGGTIASGRSLSWDAVVVLFVGRLSPKEEEKASGQILPRFRNI
jgi:hypothetical protein